jgi:hypothetical protein
MIPVRPIAPACAGTPDGVEIGRHMLAQHGVEID